MNTFWILLEQIGLFVIYIIIGALLIKTKVFTEITIESISRFVLKLALPVMIFVNIAGGVDRRTLFQSAGNTDIYLHFLYFTFLIGKGLSRLFPVIFYLLLGFFQTPEEIRLTMSLLGAMPAMSSVVMMAKASGSEGDYAMGGVFVTTLCSIVTIPAVCWILQNLLS